MEDLVISIKYNVESFFRDSKILEIGEGTSEVQIIIIFEGNS